MSRALTLLAVLALPACAEINDRSLGGDIIVPVDAGVIADAGMFPFDLEECKNLQTALQQLALPRGPDGGIPEYCNGNASRPGCPLRPLLALVYLCAGRIQQQILDEANGLDSP